MNDHNPNSLMDSADDQTSRLLSLLVHELRAPAAVISGYLRMLTKSGGARLSDADRKMIEDAGKCCARLLRIVQEVDDYVDLERPESITQLEIVSVFDLCEEAVREAAGEDRRVTFACPSQDRSASVHGAPARLKQALAALIAFTVREHGALPVEVECFVSRDSGQASAVIVFGEPGFAKRRDEVLSARSNEFDCWRGGMGLVVPLAGRIVEFHGGRLWSLPAAHAASAISLPLASG
jgi:signal transduction histidine kinase